MHGDGAEVREVKDESWILAGMDEGAIVTEIWSTGSPGRGEGKIRKGKMKVSFTGDSDVICYIPAICVHFLDVLKILKQWVTAKCRLFLIVVK